jgi:molybdopterin-guanine dinucleotide biosynthesis protein B
LFNKVIIAVVGSSNSGKTTAVEIITKGLTEKGYTVASAKRIPEADFTIDTEGKDTYRLAKAGASTVLSVAPNELGVIKKVDTTKLTLEQLISEIPEETDVIIVEGFKNLVVEDMTIPKIVATKTGEERLDAQKRYKNILAFITQSSDEGIEVETKRINAMKEPKKLVDLVIQKVAVQVERKHKREEKITIQINDEMLPLGDFVQDIVRNSVIAMVASLKGAKIKGEEKVSIDIKRLKRG